MDGESLIGSEGSSSEGTSSENLISSSSDPRDTKEKLREWAVTSQLSHQKLDELLKILREDAYPMLPKSAKTFLETVKSVQFHIEKFPDSSELVYFGIESQLKPILKTSLHPNNTVELLFNMDGIPLFKSSSKQFWPILGLVYHVKNYYKPFPIAIQCGNSKTSDVNRYLDQFVCEVNKLQLEGFNVKERVYKVTIKGFICDRPPRSLIKCVKNRGAYFACERCTVRGKRAENRTVYTDLDCAVRTHASFVHEHNIQHHTGISPLLELNNIDMVNMFILDFMHLGCLGVMKRLFEFWLDKKSARKFSFGNRTLLSKKLIALKSQIPAEFQRTTRDLSDI